MNSNRQSNKAKRWKGTDLFDREALEAEREKRSRRATPQRVAEDQERAQERAARLPLPKKLREHR